MEEIREHFKRAYQKADEMQKKMEREGSRYVDCEVCGRGKYGGVFMQSCDNYECLLWVSFYMERCYICRQPRRDCCC